MYSAERLPDEDAQCTNLKLNVGCLEVPVARAMTESHRDVTNWHANSSGRRSRVLLSLCKSALKRFLVVDHDDEDKSNNCITRPQPSREPSTPISVSFLAIAGWWETLGSNLSPPRLLGSLGGGGTPVAQKYFKVWYIGT